MRWMGVAVAALAVLVATSVSPLKALAAIDWQQETVIARNDRGSIIVDASYRGQLAAVAWRSGSLAFGTLRVAITTDAGRSAFVKRIIARNVEAMGVAACSKVVLIAYVERVADNGLRLRLARVPAAGGTITRLTISRHVQLGGGVDVGCGARHATVAWTERIGSVWHALACHVRIGNLSQTAAVDLGVARRGEVVVAGAAGSAYVAWAGSGGVRLARYAVGSGPGVSIEKSRVRTVARYGARPVLSASGSTLTLGYSALSDAEVRLSDDGGRTFVTGTSFGPDPGEASVVSLARQRQHVVATLQYATAGHSPSYYRMSSRDRGTSWRTTRLSTGLATPIDGLLVSATGVKLAETFVRTDATIRELVFRREG